MADVFISYSRKDSTEALELADGFRSSGIEVWMDRSGIDAATSWSEEIVKAIDNCSVFVLLLSAHSVASEQVMREVSLAFESKRNIMPIALDEVQLPTGLRYQLAGLQRTKIADRDAIVRGLSRFGIDGSSEIPHLRTIEPKAAPIDTRTSLMVLPFEDLSPERDNDWFADGLVSELITALGNISTLRLIDQNTTRRFKHHAVQTSELARELNVRYFLEGTVRKFQTEIKVSVQLLDTATGQFVWSHSHRGEFKDIFDIQEQIAEQIVGGLKLHLTPKERTRLDWRETTSPEAYECFLRAREYHLLRTHVGHERALELLKEALRIDGQFATALQLKASILADGYRLYERDTRKLDEAEAIAQRVLEIRPEMTTIYSVLSYLYLYRGDGAKAESTAIEYVRREPELAASHASLGFVYSEQQEYAKAIPHYERALQLEPDNLACHYNLIAEASSLNDHELERTYAERAIPYFAKRKRLFPEDEMIAVAYAEMLYTAGRNEEAIVELRKIESNANLDGVSIYGLAVLYAKMEAYDLAIAALRRAVDAGYSHLEELLLLRDGKLYDDPAYRNAIEEIIQTVETKCGG